MKNWLGATSTLVLEKIFKVEVLLWPHGRMVKIKLETNRLEVTLHHVTFMGWRFESSKLPISMLLMLGMCWECLWAPMVDSALIWIQRYVQFS